MLKVHSLSSLYTLRSKLVSYIKINLFFFVLFRVASSPEQQGRYVPTGFLLSRPLTTNRDYVMEMALGAGDLQRNSRQAYRRLVLHPSYTFEQYLYLDDVVNQ